MMTHSLGVLFLLLVCSVVDGAILPSFGVSICENYESCQRKIVAVVITNEAIISTEVMEVTVKPGDRMSL